MSVSVNSTWAPLTLPDTVPMISVVGSWQYLQMAEKLPEIACPDSLRTTSKIAAPSSRDHVPVKSTGGVGVAVGTVVGVTVGVGMPPTGVGVGVVRLAVHCCTPTSCQVPAMCALSRIVPVRVK